MQPIDLDAARRYLAPPPLSFWQWRDEGEVIAWSEGRTIAFRGELIHILRRRASEGLPPLGAVLLLLAATRDAWGSPPSEWSAVSGLISSLSGHEATPGTSETTIGLDPLTPKWIKEVFEGLDRVRALPRELRNNTAARAELVALVCEGWQIRDREIEAEAVIRVLERGLPEEIFAPAVKHGPAAPTAKSQLDLLLGDLHCLHVGLPRVDRDRLTLREKTGLDDLPTAAQQELPPAEQVRALIAKLKDDAELGGVARLAIDMMAAIRLPRPISDREDLPLDGISDISNRGALDRLLVSELANDDLTLAVRIAVNEALYLRRETPPRNPPHQRFVLLDAGIRMWGIPRVFATAVGMALAATSERNISVSIFRAAGNEIVPVDFTSRDGLVAHLAALESTAHPAAALAAFAERAAACEHPADGVIITGEDVLADRNFSTALARMESPAVHLGSVGRSGRFRLFGPKSGRQRPLCDVRMELQEILAKRESSPPLIDRQRTIAPPAIISVKPFPLLLPHQIDPKRAWAVNDHGVFSITRDRRLLHWTTGKSGARQLADFMPEGQLHWASVTPSDVTTRAVAGRLSKRGLWLISVDPNIGRCESKCLMLGGDGPRGVASHNGAILVFFDRHVEAFSLDGGTELGSCSFPTASRWLHGRFLVQGRPTPTGVLAWYAVGFDGNRPLAELVHRTQVNPGNLIAMFDAVGIDGPVGVTWKGDFYFCAERSVKRVKHGLNGPIKMSAVSRDGSWLALEGILDGRSARRLIEVANQDVKPYMYNPGAFSVELGLWTNAYSRSTRHRFDAIAVLPGQRLALRSKKGQVWSKIEVGQHVPHSVYLRPIRVDGLQLAIRPFDRDCSDPNVGYSLRAAVWDDGSLGFLDSRGMLHLRSADPSIPEATLVLTDGGLWGWIADGRQFGPSDFTGIADRTPVDVVFRTILEPFAAHVPC